MEKWPSTSTQVYFVPPSLSPPFKLLAPPNLPVPPQVWTPPNYLTVYFLSPSKLLPVVPPPPATIHSSLFSTIVPPRLPVPPKPRSPPASLLVFPDLLALPKLPVPPDYLIRFGIFSRAAQAPGPPKLLVSLDYLTTYFLAAPKLPMLQRRGGLDQKMIEGLELTFSSRGVIG